MTFVDGTEREVDRDSNVTLRVEVASSTPNYTLLWDCFPIESPEASCFQQPDMLSTFPTTTIVGESFFSRLHHLWELLYNSSSNSLSNNKNSPPPTGEDNNFLQNALNTSNYYIVTLTFPASALLTTYTRFHFMASVTRNHPLPPVNASQLVVVKSSRDK